MRADRWCARVYPAVIYVYLHSVIRASSSTECVHVYSVQSINQHNPSLSGYQEEQCV